MAWEEVANHAVARLDHAIRLVRCSSHLDRGVTSLDQAALASRLSCFYWKYAYVCHRRSGRGATCHDGVRHCVRGVVRRAGTRNRSPRADCGNGPVRRVSRPTDRGCRVGVAPQQGPGVSLWCLYEHLCRLSSQRRELAIGGCSSPTRPILVRRRDCPRVANRTAAGLSRSLRDQLSCGRKGSKWRTCCRFVAPSLDGGLVPADTAFGVVGEASGAG